MPLMAENKYKTGEMEQFPHIGRKDNAFVFDGKTKAELPEFPSHGVRDIFRMPHLQVRQLQQFALHVLSALLLLSTSEVYA